METVTKEKIDTIMATANSSRKGDYSVYSSLKRELEDLVLSPSEYVSTVVKLARTLRI